MTSPAPPETTADRPTGGVPRWLVILAIITAILLALAALVSTGILRPRPTPPVTSIATVAHDNPGVVGLIVLPEDGRTPILAELAAAQTSIKLIVYLLSDEAIVQALIDAADRGVSVQVMLEEHPYGGGGGQDDMFARLAEAGIDVRWADPVYRFSHIKTFIIDDQVALIMNLNLSNSAFTGNRELAVITTRPDDVAQAVAIFAADWDHTGVTPPGPLVVSPTTSRNDLLHLISRASSTLDIYAEVSRDEQMLRAIQAAADRGVRVRLVMSGNANDNNAAGRAQLAAAGAEVHLSSEHYIHAKMFLVDGRELFVGSQNMTGTSLDQNRELGIILTDRASIERASRVFDADFRAARRET